ncbi:MULTISPECIES: hypothetical protein [Rhodococcus]|uniref:Membrane-associated oxidoreductase n=1 Tax=Rhodococcus opacus RKJ300 = JCM 13270 TaxID=1165867 RepID=I0WZD4_RHOOP|nr:MULTISPECIES: hypothetical protein [Rhodococcus]EID81750.1 hypothetical protein W59_01229 [Rhodococcus opacus RKJ300 = JCM 13270]QQZ18716.1 hypothetical protein GO592_34740 [Rhodococcus sp. 21391]
MADTLTEDEWFERLKAAAQEGEIVNLVPADARPTFANPEHADLWDITRTIPSNAVRRVLALPESTVRTFAPRGLQIRGAYIRDDIDWNHIVFPRPLMFTRCAFASSIALTGARISTLSLSECAGQALRLEGAKIEGNLNADQLTLTGDIRAIGLHVGERFVLNSTILTNPDDVALNLDGARLDDGLFAERVTATGEVRAIGARIGELVLNEATLMNPDGDALDLSGTHVSDGLHAYRLIAIGHVAANGAQFNNGLHLDEATFSVAATSGYTAFDLSNTRITGDVEARDLATCGTLSMLGARTHGRLLLDGATLTNPFGYALELDNVQIDGSLSATLLTAIGGIRAEGAKIADEFGLLATTLSGNSHEPYETPTLRLYSATVGRLTLLPQKISGTVDLSSSTIKTLTLPRKHNTEDDWQPESFADAVLHVAGWSVVDIEGPIRSDWTAIRDHLSTTSSTEFIPQPWFEIANVYERNGHPDQARALRLHTESQITRNTRGTTKAIRRIYAATVGYGYRPFLPVLWLLGVLIIAGLLIWTNHAHFLNVNQLPTTANDVCTDSSGHACFNTIGYTLQNVVPAASGPLRPDWILSTSGWWPITLGVVLAVLRLLAWGFAALTLTAMTGLLRRR